MLVAPLGLWQDEQPDPRHLRLLPFQFGDCCSTTRAARRPAHRRASTSPTWTRLREFFIGNARRLGTAGKILFPIPNRRLSKRLYRLSTRRSSSWGEQRPADEPGLCQPVGSLLPSARLVHLPDAGHMLPYEQPAALARELEVFLGGR